MATSTLERHSDSGQWDSPNIKPKRTRSREAMQSVSKEKRWYKDCRKQVCFLTLCRKRSIKALTKGLEGMPSAQFSVSCYFQAKSACTPSYCKSQVRHMACTGHLPEGEAHQCIVCYITVASNIGKNGSLYYCFPQLDPTGMKWPLTIRSATLLMTPPQGIPPTLVCCIREPDLHMGARGQSGSAMNVVNQAKHGKTASNKAGKQPAKTCSAETCLVVFSCIDLYWVHPSSHKRYSISSSVA